MLNAEILPPGSFRDHPIVYEYGASEANLSGFSSTYFGSGDVYKNKVTDENGGYTPNFSLLKKNVPPIGSLAFVTNEESNNITVIDCFEYKVVDVIKTGQKPRDIIYSEINRQLYVANEGSNSISVIDIDLRKVIRTIDMVYGDLPNRLLLSEYENLLYILNYGSSSLSIYDTNLFEEIIKIYLEDRPVSMAVDRNSEEIYITTMNTESMLIIDPENPYEFITLWLNQLSGELELGYNPGYVFLAQSASRFLTILDGDSGEKKSTINVCSPITSMVYDNSSLILYALLKNCQEISIIDPESEFEIETIELDCEPGIINLDNQRKQIMVTCPDFNKIQFYNLNSRKKIAELDVGQKPYKVIQP